MKFQDTKFTYRKQLHFYTLIMNYQKEKLRKQSHLKLHQKNKISRNKYNQDGKRPVIRKL